MARKVGIEELNCIRQDFVSQGIDKRSPFILGAIDAELLLKDGFSTFWVNGNEELTTIAVVQLHGHTHVYVFYSSNREHLRQILCGIVKWNDSIQLVGSPIWSPLLFELAEAYAPESKLIADDKADFYYATKETTANIPLPPGYSFDKLHFEDSDEVDRCWEHRSEGLSLQLFQRQIQHLPSVAIRDTAGNLLAFELVGPFLNNFSLFVYPEHRRKGLATAITCEINKKGIAMREVAFTYIDDGNDKSVELHTKCGFTRVEEGRMAWTVYRPLHSKKPCLP